MRIHCQPCQHQRGMALLGTMVFLFFILGIAMIATLGRSSGLTTSADAGLKQISDQADAQTARDLAETGIRITSSWLLQQDKVNSATQPFAPSTVGTDFYGASVEDGYNVIALSQAPTAKENAQSLAKASRVRVRLYPGTDPTTGHQILVIQSIGESGFMRYTSRLTVRPKSYVEYGLFYDEPLANFVWMAGTHTFTGPVHLNMRLPGTNTVDTSAIHTIIWNTTNQLFTYPDAAYFTCTGAPSQILWFKGLVTPLDPTTGDWPSIATAGVAPKFNVPVIPFPSTTANLKNTALGGITEPTTTGVTIPGSGSTLGGVYINGAVNRMTMSTSGSGNINQVMTIYQTNGTTPIRSVVTLDRIAGITQIQRYSTVKGVETLTSSESYKGITNGVVYINGDVGDTASLTGGISGTLANSVSADSPSLLTLALPEDKTLQFEGSLVYQRLITGGTTANPISTATQADDLCGILGIVTGRQWIVENDSEGKPIRDISIHAALLALNASSGNPSVGTTNYKKRPNGKYYHLGAMAIKKDGPFGYFLYDKMGVIVDQYGFNRQRLYDMRLQNMAPPFFPVASRAYNILSFQSGVDSLP